MPINKLNKKLLLTLVFPLILTCAYAQDLTGYWQGEFSSDMAPILGRRTFFMNMTLIQNGKKIEGRFSTAQMAFPERTQIVYEISGKIGKHDSLPSRLFCGKILLDLLPEGIARSFWALDDIHYIKNDTAEYLFGTWLPNGSYTPRSDGAGGVFWVRKLPIDKLLKEKPPADSPAISRPDSLLFKYHPK